MTLVLDASAVVDLLLRNRNGDAVRGHLTGADLHTVAHLDAEVFSALARLHRDGALSAEAVDARLRALSRMDVLRLPITGALLQEAWALRNNITARDALYVALARRLRGRLLTTDRRLVRAVPGICVALPADPVP
ncbi:type II toxin-antitoxin system VapC family toxin [Pseudonocardia sp. MH-G8]|uniref:type II toxin-antitoxin system VapC family toxin n=1 Tax=Pseudonocardia sp. MH-G8 TaxID=1854588 RepID=UPI000B9FF6D3|nr:type II toxin-antitoxin system VapC family toxin [Pseudonocardia sp. MH-G8]OZM79158.1 VapC toxin family PIN domain ribonuclease [Pseudonocardia sp. MH-G8]